jgi:aspartate dehydrogenase
MCRIGIVGFGHLGQHLVQHILSEEGQQKELELAFIWNRTSSVVTDHADPRIRNLYIADLNDFSSYNPDIIVEVAHPTITETYGLLILQSAHYFCGSPTCFANPEMELALPAATSSSKEHSHALFVPAGALWGSLDIQKMAADNTLATLTITMKKNFHHLRLTGDLKVKLDEAIAEDRSGECVLYDGPVRSLCTLAPNNTNTMACAAIASLSAPASPLGFEGTRGILIGDSSLQGHIIEVTAEGADGYRVTSSRYNPAKAGAVTGNATFASFVSSLLSAVKVVRECRNPTGVRIV